MQQEQDTCRICSGPGEPDQPLFYPCKCSGTIRYIHQECLKTWLNHSKKTTCDVCKHPYSFTKVYAPDMPARMPVTIIVRKFAEQAIAVVLFMLRATLVAFVWLTLLPYGTVLTWRLYFRMGDVLAWWISLHPRPVTSSSHPTTNSSLNASSTRNVPLNTSTSLQQPLSEVLLQPYLRNLSADIFTGQIIASLIVLAFLAIFLLREWIQQNARPGVFDDGPIAEVPAPIDPQPQMEPHREEPVVNHDLQPENAAEQAPEVAENVGPQLLPRGVPDVPEDVPPAGPSSSSSETEGPSPRPAPPHVEDPLPKFGRRRREIPKKKLRIFYNTTTRKRYILEEPGVDMELASHRLKRETEDPFHFEMQPEQSSSSSGISRSGLYALEGGPTGGAADSQRPEDESAGGSGSESMFEAGFKTRQKRKASDGDLEPENKDDSSTNITRRSLSPPPADFEFTFKLPLSPTEGPSTFPTSFTFPKNGEFRLRPGTRSSSQSSEPSSPSIHTQSSISQHHVASAHPPSGLYGDTKPNHLTFELPPLNENSRGALTELPYPLTPRSSAPLSTSSSSLVSDDAERTSFQFNSPTQTPSSPSTPSHSVSTPRRPPLPVSTLPAAEPMNAEASSSAASADAVTTPLPSPRMATYRPPEELKVEEVEYFDTGHVPQEHGVEDEEDEDEEDDTRFAYYFQEPEQDDGREVPPPLLPDTDDEDDEDDGHDGEEVRDGVGARPPGDIPPVARDGGGQDVDVEAADEERDQNLEEDLDGAMEAVGLRGPLFSVFQNAALMLFILNVSIGGGVWIPFTLGKTVALLTLEPRRAIQILHLPIRAVRLVTDPSVDVVIYCLRLLGIYLLAWGKTICIRALYYMGPLAGKDVQDWAASLTLRMNSQRILSLFALTTEGHGLFPSQVGKVTSGKLFGIDVLSHIPFDMHKDSPVSFLLTSVTETSTFRVAEEGFAIFGHQVRGAFVTALEEWAELAEGDGAMARLWAILLGYAIAAFLAALYLNTFTVGNVRSVGRAVRNAIRQQMIVLKVALFIVVELVMFPFGCGVMLDFSTLVLFPEATVESRVAFFLYAPITAAFYHWLIGTMFMYQFAILLATCRDILRPGCMWFIKDPQDPTFHPIRDILDRPTLAQLRKLSMSAMMYGVVISLGVGCLVWGLTVVTPSLLPLRWKMREPLSEIPIDLLFVHLILPSTLYYFRPRKPVRRMMTAWWKWAAHQLRLTSFMFGGRHPSEEHEHAYRSWCNLLPGNKDQALVARDGGFRRAPAGDNIAFLRDRPALVEVDADGVPIDPNGREILMAQNAEAQQAGRNYEEDYTVVYVPPNFRRRIFQFIALFWFSGSLVLVSAVAAPIIAGRAFFRLFTARELHDGYSFVVGFYLLWWGWLVGSLFVRVRIRRQRHGGSRRIRAGWFLFLLKRVSVYISKIAWLVFWLGIVLPTLVSIAVDLYIVIPLRYYMSPNFTPTIHVFESWATGLILSKIIIRTQRTRQGNDLNGALDAIQRNGWRRPDPWAATKDFIIPVGTGLLGMILLPPVIIYGFTRLVSTPSHFKDLFRLIYPSIFVTVAASQFAVSLVGVFAKWTQSIRDKEFLVELRLRNLDYSRKPEKVEPSSAVASTGDPEEDEIEVEEDD